MAAEFKGKKYRLVGEPKEIKIKVRGQHFYVYKYRGNFTRDEMYKYATYLSKKLKRQDPTSEYFQVTTLYGENIYRSGSMTKTGDEASLFLEYDDMDLGPIKGFNITASMS